MHEKNHLYQMYLGTRIHVFTVEQCIVQQCLEVGYFGPFIQSSLSKDRDNPFAVSKKKMSSLSFVASPMMRHLLRIR